MSERGTENRKQASMDEKTREKERRNDLFARGELRALLKLFSSLGITVAVGITGFFVLGLYVDRKLTEWGWRTGGSIKIIFLLGGVAMSIYWAYLRIARHLEKYDPKDADARDDGDGEK